MATIIPFQAPLTPDRALKRIQEAMRDTGRLLGWTTHALEKLGEEIVMRQVLTVVAEGQLKKGPTWSEEFGDWVCVLRKSVSGRTTHVVIGLYEGRSEITVITVY